MAIAPPVNKIKKMIGAASVIPFSIAVKETNPTGDCGTEW